MAWNIFKKNKKEVSLEERVNIALAKTKEDKRNAQKEIRDINKWAADAIIDTYSAFFPNSNLTYYRKQYEDTALKDYESIKEKYADKLEPEIVEKCDRFVTGYLNQLQLRESKLKLYEKIEAKYKRTKDKLKNAHKTEKRTNDMQEHADRLKALDNSSDTLSDAMSDTYKAEDLEEDIEQKEEYFNQLEKLNEKFSDESDYNNSLAFKDEIDKMIEDMD